MLDFTDFGDDLEKTQSLPMLTAALQLDETLSRERAARIEIVELLRQNFELAKEIEQLRHGGHKAPVSDTIRDNTEDRLFEVCAALKNTLSRVLEECHARGIALESGIAACRTLDDCCDTLEQVLSAPDYCTPTIRANADMRLSAHILCPMPDSTDKRATAVSDGGASPSRPPLSWPPHLKIVPSSANH